MNARAIRFSKRHAIQCPKCALPALRVLWRQPERFEAAAVAKGEIIVAQGTPPANAPSHYCPACEYHWRSTVSCRPKDRNRRPLARTL